MKGHRYDKGNEMSSMRKDLRAVPVQHAEVSGGPHRCLQRHEEEFQREWIQSCAVREDTVGTQ